MSALLSLTNGVLPDESLQLYLLLSRQFPELQSNLPHFDYAKTKFALNFEIGYFYKGHPVQVEALVAQKDPI